MKREVRLNDSCKLDNDHRPCELASAIGFALDISAEAGVQVTPALDEIAKRGDASESEVQSALKEWRKTLPKAWSKDGQYLYEVAFPKRK